MQYRLKDCLEKVIDNRGKNPTYFDKEKYPVIDNVYIKNNYYINDKIVNRYIDQETYDNFLRGYVENDMPIMTLVGSGIGNVGLIKNEKVAIVQNTIGFKTKSILESKYLYYWFLTKQQELQNFNRGSGQPSIKKTDIENMIIELPEIKEQRRIVNILEKIDDKIELNNQINDNLEKQLIILFNEMFFKNIKNNNTNEFEEKILYDVLEVIDNRGKTPKLVETSDYPILDVRALSGNGRIINYDMCEKYVDEEVYNTFFRSGHPKKNDILLSTVGSLAEMKLFIENKGTVAQNVVALRSKIDYPMYIYQYLKAIKSDLISYNIGSVQPSIKVTQFMKHSFYLPKSDELRKFENISVAYTNKMFNLHKEIESLTQLRDTLLPKLMNGEIDLDKIEI